MQTVESSFRETGASVARVVPAANRDPSAADLQLGDVLPGTSYVLQSRIVRGWAIDVYGSVDPRTGASVALKVLHGRPRMAAVASFAREVQMLQRLAAVRPESVRVVRLLAASQLPDGRPWLALSRPHAVSLSDLLRRPWRSAGRAVRILRGAALALADVHAAGIVHRYVEPGNLLVVTRKRSDDVVLVDFANATRCGAAAFAAGVADDLRGLAECAWRLLEPGRVESPAWVREVFARCEHPDPSRRIATAADLARALAVGMRDGGAAFGLTSSGDDLRVSADAGRIRPRRSTRARAAWR